MGTGDVERTGGENGALTGGAFGLYLVISTAAVFVFLALFYFSARYEEAGLPGPTAFLFSSRDRFMDFFNLVLYSRDLSTQTTGVDSPLFMLLAHLVSGLFTGGDEIRYEMRKTAAGAAVYGAYIALSLGLFFAAFAALLKKFRAGPGMLAWSFAAFVFSYPVLFAMDRGNYILMAAGFTALFAVNYSNGRYITAALFAALAAALKYYPILFLLVFLADRKWLGAAVTAVTAAALLLVSMMFFRGGLFRNINYLAGHICAYQTTGFMYIAELLGHNNSIYMLGDVPYAAANGLCAGKTAALAGINGLIRMFSYLLLAASAALAMARGLKLHDRLMVLGCVMMLFPLVAGDYMLTLLAVPAVMWLLNEPFDRLMPWLLSLLPAFKRFFVICTFQDVVSVTVQSVLNPLLLLSVIVYIAWLRRRELKAQARDITLMLSGRKAAAA